jgi:hypothetical protein
LIFCDLSTPKGDREFSVYDDLKKKLIDLGVPADEVAFIHDANTETKKAELFARVHAGQVRILLGSTAKFVWSTAFRLSKIRPKRTSIMASGWETKSRSPSEIVCGKLSTPCWRKNQLHLNRSSLTCTRRDMK